MEGSDIPPPPPPDPPAHDNVSAGQAANDNTELKGVQAAEGGPPVEGKGQASANAAAGEAARDNASAAQAAADNAATGDPVESGGSASDHVLAGQAAMDSTQSNAIEAAESGPPVEPANDNHTPTAADLARVEQAMTDSKFGVDDWKNETRDTPTVVWAASPGNSGFAVFADTASQVDGDAREYGRVTQSTPRRGQGESEPTYRAELRAYEIPAGHQIAVSTASNSPQWGPGGAQQCFVPNFKEVAEPLDDRIQLQSNRSAVWLAKDDK
jgi:hypothetical protein